MSAEDPLHNISSKEKNKIISKPEEDLEFLKVVYDCARKELEEYYGVNDLTPIEAGRLRAIIKDVIKDDVSYDRDIKDNYYKEGGIQGTQVFRVDEEAVSRWMYELYGIKSEDIIATYSINGYITCQNRTELKRKIAELEYASENITTIQTKPTEEFKKHFKKIRQEAHEQWS
jgi:hypothetical protein